ncbi:MAG: shikimate dehydrogenase, partial [Pseudomonadota bacterium]
ISHSLSPLIHNGWLRDLGIDATYEAFHVPDEAFAGALQTLQERGAIGLNITLPHKAAALAAARGAGMAAARIGAANTLTHLGDGAWRADNTDAPGFMRALGPVDPNKDRALILGAGGSARAIVFALTNAKIPVIILNRTEARAAELGDALGDTQTVYGSIDQYNEYIDQATIVINTTSMGYSGETLDLPAGDGRTFYDISYGKICDAQLAHARKQGWQTKDGLSMLVAQAALSFEIWFQVLPDLDSGLHRCRFALQAAS